jgi:hypothetical protein
VVYVKRKQRSRPVRERRTIIVKDTILRSSLASKDVLNVTVQDDEILHRGMVGYSVAARCFHWLTAGLVLVTFILSIGAQRRAFLPKEIKERSRCMSLSVSWSC